jgi:hypothetical protein
MKTMTLKTTAAFLLLLGLPYRVLADPPLRTPEATVPTQAEMDAVEVAVDGKAGIYGENVDASAFRESLLLNDTAIPDALSWQPFCVAKMLSTSGNAPLNVLVAGDSLSTLIRMPPNAATVGVIGCSRLAAAVNVTDYAGGGNPQFADVWIAPYHRIAVGGSAIYHVGGQGVVSPVIPMRANTVSVMYVAENGAATFDVHVSTDNGTTWSPATGGLGINANNGGAMTGQVFTASLSISNGPRYLARISNVTGGGGASVRIMGVGLYSTTGQGIIELRGLANQGGIDSVNYGNVPDAVFTPFWNHMSPDLVVSHYADAPEEWQETKLALGNVVTNGTTSISFSAYPPAEYANGNAYRPFLQVGDYITGPNIPPNTRITAHSRNGTTATMSNAATGSGTSTATIRGAMVSFHDRCRAIKAATDWVQFSMNPTMSPALSGHQRWAGGVTYAAGTRVTTYNPDASMSAPRIERVYVAKAGGHTSGSTTEPNAGASWATVWDEDLQDAASVAAGTARARQQAKAQREWAMRTGQSFINGFDIFRDYTSACLSGLMAAPDMIHPSAAGYAYKNMVFWSKVPLTRVNLGALGNLSGGGVNAVIFSTITPTDVINNAAGVVELGRSLRVAGQGGEVRLGDRAAIENTAVDVTLRNISGEFFIGDKAVGGLSSMTGIHPPFDGAVLGGRNGFWWNLGGGGLRLGYQPVSGNHTVLAKNYFIHVTSGSPVITLPDATAESLTAGSLVNVAAGLAGKMYVIKNTGAGTASVKGFDAVRGSGVTTNASTSISFASNGSAPNVGDRVSGTNIPADTYIVTANTVSATMSNAATAAGSGLSLTFTEALDGITPVSLAPGASKKYASTGASWVEVP